MAKLKKSKTSLKRSLVLILFEEVFVDSSNIEVTILSDEKVRETISIELNVYLSYL